MKYQNLGLYADLEQCEDGLLDLINHNFLLIDSLWVMSVEGRVTELPGDAVTGEMFLLTNDIYSGGSFDLFIKLHNSFRFIPLKSGMWFFDKSENDFFYYSENDSIMSFTNRYGNVKSTLNTVEDSIARYRSGDGFITDSDVLLSRDSISNLVNLEVENIYSGNIETEVIMANNYLGISQPISIDINKMTMHSSFNSITPEGKGSVITTINSEYLESGFFMVRNSAGGSVRFESGGNIIIPDGFYILKNNETISIFFDSTTGFYYIENKTRSEVVTVQNYSDLEDIEEIDRYEGLICYVSEYKENLQLQGGTENNNWKKIGSGKGSLGGVSWEIGFNDSAPTRGEWEGLETFKFTDISQKVRAAFVTPEDVDFIVVVKFPVVSSGSGSGAVVGKIEMIREDGSIEDKTVSTTFITVGKEYASVELVFSDFAVEPFNIVKVELGTMGDTFEIVKNLIQFELREL